MRAVRKAHGDKVILDNVTLAFLPGAKIGVVGPNGTGKSTLLKMMAGMEQPSNGDARLMPGFTVGILLAGAAAQRGQDRPRQRRGGRRRDQGDCSTASTRSPRRWPTDYCDELLKEMGKLRTQLDHRTAGTWTASWSRRWTRCAARRRTPR